MGEHRIWESGVDERPGGVESCLLGYMEYEAFVRVALLLLNWLPSNEAQHPWFVM